MGNARGFVIVGRPGREDRAPLPAGHPASWDLLTAGTVLQGSPYPHPVFLDRVPSSPFAERPGA